jgi:outer membrane lipoprotein SlyB
MNSPDPIVPGSSPETEPVALGTAAAPEKAAEPAVTLPPAGRLIALALGAGIVASLLAWGIGEKVFGLYKPPFVMRTAMGRTVRQVRFEDQAAADSKNAVLAFAALGGVLGLSLGIAGGIARNSTSGSLVGAIAGCVLGSAITAGASWVCLPFYFKALARDQEKMGHDLVVPLLVHAGIWATCGLAAGVAFGIGLRAGWLRMLNAALGGLIGAAMGAAVYELVGAMVFLDAQTTEPVAATWQARLFARVLVAALAAVTAATMINMQSNRFWGGQAKA